MNFDDLVTERIIYLTRNDLRDEDLDVIVDVLRKSKVLESLRLQSNQLTLADGKFTDALANNHSLKGLYLYLDYNKIGAEGAERLADALKFSKTLKRLNLRDNEIGDEGVRYIADALMENETLEVIDLDENNIGDEGANMLVDVLLKSDVLETLYLSDNQLTLAGGKFADALANNHSLKYLNLIYNTIGDEGAKRLADALKVNNTLKWLYLCRNQIGDKGAKHFADALKENESLELIDLIHNKIGDDGANSLANCFMDNQSIRKVYLHMNIITDIGARKLIEGLKWNCDIEYLTMWNDLISKHVKAEIKDLLDDPKRDLRRSRSQMKHVREKIKQKDEAMEHLREEVGTLKTALAEQEKEIATLKKALATEDRMRNAARKDSTISKHGVQKVPVSKKRRKRGTMNTENKIEMDRDRELVQKIMNDIVDSGEQVKLDDIAGLEVAKRIVNESITCPMLRPDLFTGLRACPKGLLLFGPPGTGKTLIGKAIACESGATFFSVSSSSLTSKWEGDGEKLVRTMFDVAYHRAPSVIFMDEVDSLLTQRKSDESEASRRIKTEFLVQLDGVGNTRKGHVLFIGATNRPQELDAGIRRRFEKRIYIPLPKQQARETLLRNLLAKNSNSLSDGQMKSLSRDADGFSGADLSNLCRDAAKGPLRDLDYDMSVAAKDLPPISYDHFQHSLSASNRSVAEEELVVYEEWNKLYGSS